MLIGLLIAVVAGLFVYTAFAPWLGLVAGITVFAIWFALRVARRNSRQAGGDGQYSGSADGVGSSDATSSSHSGAQGPSFKGGGGTSGGAGASGFWGNF